MNINSSIRRNYGIDLLKIVAMLMIVAGHVILSGGVNDVVVKPEMRGTMAYCVVFGFRLVTICAVNCFVLATGYLYFGKKVKVSRAVELWLQMVFLSVSVLSVALACGYHPSSLDVVKTFLPLVTYHYWFMTQYFFLLLLIPILNRLVENVDGRFAVYAIVVLLFVFSVIPTATASAVVPVNGGYCVVWFAVLYLIGACVKKWNVERRLGLGMSATLFIVGYVGSFGVAVYGAFVGRFLPAAGGWLCFQYNSPFVLLEALSLFLFFAKTNIAGSVMQKMLATISSLVFGVYILHSNSVFRTAFHWNGHWSYIVEGHPLLIIVKVIGVAFVIFAGACVVDYVRLRLFALVKSLIGRRLVI